jgi:hypothetical protein
MISSAEAASCKLQADQLRAASQAVLPGMGPGGLGRGSPAAQADAAGDLGQRSRRATSESEGHRSALSFVSEAQKSLASLTSLLSADMQRMRARARTRRQSQVGGLLRGPSQCTTSLPCLNHVT